MQVIGVHVEEGKREGGEGEKRGKKDEEGMGKQKENKKGETAK